MSDSHALATYRFTHANIRVVEIDGEPWFVAKDVAEALGYTWSGSRIKHVPEEWRGVTSVVTPSGVQEMAVLSEPGVFFFLNRSDKPQALPMQKWVAGEVLPSIRKTGGYAAPSALPGAGRISLPSMLTPDQADAMQAQIEAMQAQLDAANIVVPMADWRRLTDPRIKIGHKVMLVQDFIGWMEQLGVPRERIAEMTGQTRNTIRQNAFIARRKGGAA